MEEIFVFKCYKRIIAATVIRYKTLQYKNVDYEQVTLCIVLRNNIYFV